LTGEAGEHAKYAVVFGENPADRRGGVYAKRMELAEQQEAKRLVYFGAGHNHIANWGVPRPFLRPEAPRRFNLKAEIR
jgi:hypothetical protein